MTGTISDQLRKAADVLDRTAINQDCILSVDAFGGRIRVHVAKSEFFRKLSPPFHWENHLESTRMRVDQMIDDVEIFCLADPQTEQVA